MSRAWFESQSLEPKFNKQTFDCPIVCHFDKEKSVDVNRHEFCERCDLQDKDPDKFLKQKYDRLNGLWFEDDPDEFSFQRMRPILTVVLKNRDADPKTISVKLGRYLSEFRSEEYRHQELHPSAT